MAKINNNNNNSNNNRQILMNKSKIFGRIDKQLGDLTTNFAIILKDLFPLNSVLTLFVLMKIKVIVSGQK